MVGWGREGGIVVSQVNISHLEINIIILPGGMGKRALVSIPQE